MAGLTFVPAEKSNTRDGRQWLKDAEFSDGIKGALKQTYDSGKFLKTIVKGAPELRKVRGALRYFTDAEGWGLSVTTTYDEATDEYTIMFRAQAKRDAPSVPRKVRRRKGETEDAYVARVRETYPRVKGEKEADYATRLAAVTVPAA